MVWRAWYWHRRQTFLRLCQILWIWQSCWNRSQGLLTFIILAYQHRNVKVVHHFLSLWIFSRWTNASSGMTVLLRVNKRTSRLHMPHCIWADFTSKGRTWDIDCSLRVYSCPRNTQQLGSELHILTCKQSLWKPPGLDGRHMSCHSLKVWPRRGSLISYSRSHLWRPDAWGAVLMETGWGFSVELFHMVG